jgi:hypothetical protein
MSTTGLVEIKEVRISNIEEIMRLSRFSLRKLRRLNREQDRLYTGDELTKAELVFQLTFLRDSPFKEVDIPNIMDDKHFHNQYE